MSWEVIIEDENGKVEKTMPGDFYLSDYDKLNNENFSLLKYLDPYGDTTFNALMFRDLIKDLIELKKSLPNDHKQIELAISYAKECIEQNHMYLKFHGD